MPPKVSRAFKKYTDSKTVSFASTAYERMSADPQFASLKALIDNLKVKKDALVVAMALALRKDQDRKEEQKTIKLDLNNHLEKVCRRIEDLVEENGNNPRIITDAGFDVRTITKTEKTPVTELDAPLNLVATNLAKVGCAKLTWDESENAINYAIRFKPKAEPVWQNGMYNNKPTYTVVNLQSDTVYEFEVYAIGPNGLVSEAATTVPVYVS